MKLKFWMLIYFRRRRENISNYFCAAFSVVYFSLSIDRHITAYNGIVTITEKNESYKIQIFGRK